MYIIPCNAPAQLSLYLSRKLNEQTEEYNLERVASPLAFFTVYTTIGALNNTGTLLPDIRLPERLNYQTPDSKPHSSTMLSCSYPWSLLRHASLSSSSTKIPNPAPNAASGSEGYIFTVSRKRYYMAPCSKKVRLTQSFSVAKSINLTNMPSL